MRPKSTRLVDRLSARLGARRVRRPIAQDSHIPEIAGASLPAQMTGTDRLAAISANIAPRPNSRRARCAC